MLSDYCLLEIIAKKGNCYIKVNSESPKPLVFPQEFPKHRKKLSKKEEKKFERSNWRYFPKTEWHSRLRWPTEHTTQHNKLRMTHNIAQENFIILKLKRRS